jgi:hypothetical protein
MKTISSDEADIFYRENTPRGPGVGRHFICRRKVVDKHGGV